MRKAKPKTDKKPVKKKAPPKKKNPPKNKVGRPSVFTEENKQEIYKQLKNGANYTRACLMAGIARSKFNEWKKQGIEDSLAKKETEFTDFLDKVEQAKAFYITVLHNVVNKEAQIDAKTAMRLLEKKAKDEFGDVEKIQIDSHHSGGTNNTNTNVNIEANSDDKTEELIEILRTVRGLEERQDDSGLSDSETEQIHQDSSDS